MKELLRIKKSSLFLALLVLIIISIGVVIRVAQFPNNPPGFNQDEASAVYEAYSLAETGKDRWGNKWPIYFPAWGSGQNVLLSYLTIPVVRLFGLSIFSGRLVPLLLGLLTLPLFWFCVRPMERYPALLGLFLVAAAPWHFMLSRWALESNLVPFFMLLGCAALSQALITNYRKWIVVSLAPFALALYAYGTTVIVLPVFLGIILLLYFKRIRLNFLDWLLALGLFLIIAFPFLVHFVENYVVKQNISWVDNLLFSTPLLPSTRVSQISSGSWSNILIYNIKFLQSGLDDGTSYNLLPGFKPLLSFTVPFGVVGMLGVLYKLYKQKLDAGSRPQDVVLLIFFSWAVASLTLFFLFELNINRFNHFCLPCIVLAVWTISAFVKNFNDAIPKQTIQFLVILWFVLESGIVIAKYFTDYPQRSIRSQFNAGLQEAFEVVSKLPVEQVRITEQTHQPYVYTLFYLHYPPADFQQNADFTVEDGVYKVKRFGKYVFSDKYLIPAKEYGFLFRIGEFKSKENWHKKTLYSNESWEVGTISRDVN